MSLVERVSERNNLSVGSSSPIGAVPQVAAGRKDQIAAVAVDALLGPEGQPVSSHSRPIRSSSSQLVLPATLIPPPAQAATPAMVVKKPPKVIPKNLDEKIKDFCDRFALRIKMTNRWIEEAEANLRVLLVRIVLVSNERLENLQREHRAALIALKHHLPPSHQHEELARVVFQYKPRKVCIQGCQDYLEGCVEEFQRRLSKYKNKINESILSYELLRKQLSAHELTKINQIQEFATICYVLQSCHGKDRESWLEIAGKKKAAIDQIETTQSVIYFDMLELFKRCEISADLHREIFEEDYSAYVEARFANAGKLDGPAKERGALEQEALKSVKKRMQEYKKQNRIRLEKVDE